MGVHNNYDTISINPMQVPQILCKILGFVELKHLHCFRLVCQSWNHESIMILRRLRQEEFSAVDKLKRFNHVFQASKCCPFKRVVFSSNLFDSFAISLECSEAIRSFGSTFGSYITSIHINIGKVISSNERSGLKNIVENYLISNFPNLESLSILCYSFPSRFPIDTEDSTRRSFQHLKQFNLFMPGYEDKQQEYLKEFLHWMYKLCPSLEVIKCWNSTKIAFDSCVRNGDNASLSVASESLTKAIFESVWECNTKLYLTKLYEIQMLVKLRETDLRILSSKNLCFRKCYFLLEENIQIATFSKFIERQSQTLQTLFLEFPKNSKRVFSIESNLSLPKLRTFVLINFDGSVQFLKKCPNITHIFLKNCKIQDIPSMNLSLISHLGLCNSKNQDKLLSALPFRNLRSLVLQKGDDRSLRIVFESLPLLNNFICEGDDISDEGICGESNKILKYLFESSVKSSHETLSEFSLHSSSYPAIGNLTNLQTFSLKAKQITDASILFGVLRCPQIKNLYMHSTLELITSFGFNSLRHLMNLETIQVWVRNKGWQNQTQLSPLKLEASSSPYEVSDV